MSTNQDGVPDLELWKLADLITPMCVRVAATYRVADYLASGYKTAQDIAEPAGLHAGALNRVLRHLVTAGLLRGDGEEFELTEKGQALRSDHPGPQRSLIDLEGAIGRADLAIVELAHVVRTGEPSHQVRYGKPFWDELASDKGLAESFDAQMAGNVGEDAAKIAQAYDWSKFSHLIDLGGGGGILLGALLEAHPTLHGTVLDLPGTVERAEKNLAARGLGDRASVRGGSFFDPLPAADAYVLSSVIHDWDDAQSVDILKNCAAAAGASGRVFVIEETGSDGETPDTGMDIRMYAYYGGQERTLTENIELAKAAGLSVVKVHKAPGRVATRSVIELKVA
ncbi:methyltransferase [Streptomyces monticola]|uniref:Methyltransferase n=1 Tax=Streptomyces monticola TaxID=2666263 RepID=A0ABW2JZ34_9ACTN